MFFRADHYARYLEWLEGYSKKYRLDILAYCLMTNHVHVVAVPHAVDSLARTLHALHSRHGRMVNLEQGWTGHLWQGRFLSAPLDEKHLFAAVRYVERNPVRAGIVKQAQEYPWSSTCYGLLQHH